MFDRKKFFDGIRSGPFPGSLTPEAVQGVTAILDEWERRKLTDLRHLAYMLATALGEVGQKMLPVREGFKSTDAAARAYVKSRGYRYAAVVNGHVYYGRGLVQLTHPENYRKMGAILGLPLESQPDLALQPDVAAKIMFEGMARGTFTGKSLASYFNGTTTDWVNARRIINGTDRAAEIGGYAKQFYADIVAANTATAPAATPAATPTAPAAPAKPASDPAKDAIKTGTGAAGGAIIVGGAAAAAQQGVSALEIGMWIGGLSLIAIAIIIIGYRVTKGYWPWSSTGSQSQELSPPSPQNLEPSSEHLSEVLLAVQSVARRLRFGSSVRCRRNPGSRQQGYR